MNVEVHDPAALTPDVTSKHDVAQSSHILEKMEKDDMRHRRLQSLQKAQAVWKDIQGLLLLNDSVDLADEALERLQETRLLLENSVQGGRRLKEILQEDLGRNPIKESSVSAKVAKARGKYRKISAQQRAFESIRKSTVTNAAGIRKRVVPMDDRGAKKLRRRAAELRKRALAAEKRVSKTAAERARPLILQLDDVKYSYNPLAVPVVELDPELRDEPGTFVSGSAYKDLGMERSWGVCKYCFCDQGTSFILIQALSLHK